MSDSLPDPIRFHAIPGADASRCHECGAIVLGLSAMERHARLAHDGEYAEDDYCGCCGRVIVQGTPFWCIDCLREHIDTLARRPEKATYFAQHGEACPFDSLNHAPDVEETQ